jgi:small-conductance mechanosensitive channel
MNDKVKALLAAAESAEERCRRYSRRAALCDRLSFALYITATALMLLGATAYFFYGYDYRLPFAVSATLWIAGYAAYILRDVYDSRAAKAARKACVFRRTAETIAEIEKIKAKLEKEIDELGQELKKRGIAPAGIAEISA